ncbi:MAG: leucine-rich repeat domain-containing protein [Candidatus Aminicenantes bacterium]|nr:leucine-rich repeat domain-containing protein [Candidatus Aminicenantes bacterium]
MKCMISGLFIFLLMVIWTTGSIYGDIPRKENSALLTLFNDTGGNNWRNKDNWKNAPGTEHTWHGIACDTKNTTILKLELPDNNLQGKIPADLEALSNLTTLDLSNNRLTSAIPSWLQQLKNLKKLDLSHNQFKGPIPAWIGDLENLEELILDNNLLDCPIPAALGNLSKLKVLRLAGNGLTGDIPPALAKLSQLTNNNSDFKWNGLYTTNTVLANFLKQKQSGNDWESTQTIAPGGLAAISQTDTSITLSWKPIAYTQDKGGCRVSYSTTPGGPYKTAGVTDDKTVAKMEVKGLEKSTAYYFVLQSWTDPHGANKNKIESGFGKEFRAATRGIIISGMVTRYSDEKKSQTEELQGVRMEASNNGGTAETDKEGKYTLNVMPGWTGTVTPSLQGFDFSPRDRVYTPLKTDSGSQDFTATAGTVISGKVIYKGEGIGGVEMAFVGKQGKTSLTETGGDGSYEYIVPYNWSGTVTPQKTGHGFKPGQKIYGGVTSRLEGEDYTAEFPAISGRVTGRRGKTGIPGVRMTFSNIETDRFTYLKEDTVTDAEGNYLNQIPVAWSGSVKVSKNGYIFYPPSRDNLTEENAKSAMNFKAERDFKLFFLVSGNYLLPAESRFGDIYGSGPIYPGIAAGYKFSRNMYIWGGYALFSKNGKSTVLEKPSKWKQAYCSLGIGYYKNLSIRVAGRVSVGAMYVRFSEEAFGDKVTANTVGGCLEAAGIYKINRLLFTEISLGYLVASDTVEEISIKLGGFRAGFGLGVRL